MVCFHKNDQILDQEAGLHVSLVERCWSCSDDELTLLCPVSSVASAQVAKVRGLQGLTFLDKVGIQQQKSSRAWLPIPVYPTLSPEQDEGYIKSFIHSVRHGHRKWQQ